MKNREKLLMAAILVTASYAVWTTFRAERLRKEFATLQASHLKLQNQHRLMKDGYVRLASNPRLGDEAFRSVLATLEAEDGAELLTSSHPGNTRINNWPTVNVH